MQNTKGTQLSRSLLQWIGRFIGDVQTLCRATSVCRDWQTISDNDLTWKAQYLRDWDAESSTDSMVQINGEVTPWKVRYRQRHKIERDWKTSSQWKLSHHFSIPASAITFHVGWTRLIAIHYEDHPVITIHDEVHPVLRPKYLSVYEIATGKKLVSKRVGASNLAFNTPALHLDADDKHAAVTYILGSIVIYELDRLETKQSFKEYGSSIMAIAIRGDCLVVSHSRNDVCSFDVLHWPSSTCKRTLNIGMLSTPDSPKYNVLSKVCWRRNLIVCCIEDQLAVYDLATDLSKTMPISDQTDHWQSAETEMAVDPSSGDVVLQTAHGLFSVDPQRMTVRPTETRVDGLSDIVSRAGQLFGTLDGHWLYAGNDHVRFHSNIDDGSHWIRPASSLRHLVVVRRPWTENSMRIEVFCMV